MGTMIVWPRSMAVAALSLTAGSWACASRPASRPSLLDECNNAPSPPAVAHLALTPDSALSTAGVGVVVVRVVPDGPELWFAGDSGLFASIHSAQTGIEKTVELRQTNLVGALVADGLRSGQYDLTIRHIGYMGRTDRVIIRAGYVDTLFAALNEIRICLRQHVATSASRAHSP